ncbi:MAG: radical SAM protein [Myxococcota bacterium]|jgi:radical SAM protein with 4Fe4S-binding SPASM domain|nr:radical SAM protein [Myxococcota bacterium]
MRLSSSRFPLLRRLGHRLAERRLQLVHRLETELHELRYLFWEATRRCNLACRHCGSDCTVDHQQAGLPVDAVRGLLRRFATAYDARRILLAATGGEPLLRPDLEAMLQEAAGLGYRLGLVSNGYLLDPARARRLAGLGLQSAVISLDGPADCHNWLRRRPDAFDRACRALVLLRESGVRIVEAITVVTPRTLDRLDETYALVAGLGATHWRLLNVFPTGRASTQPELLLDGPGLVRLLREIARLRRAGRPGGPVVSFGEEGYLGWDIDRQVRDTPYFCRAGINICGLLADGGLAACPNLPAWMVQGNVHRDDPVEVWERRYGLFRDRSWTRRGACGQCDRWAFCQGNSLHLWDPAAEAPCWCQHALLAQYGDGD